MDKSRGRLSSELERRSLNCNDFTLISFYAGILSIENLLLLTMMSSNYLKKIYITLILAGSTVLFACSSETISSQNKVQNGEDINQVSSMDHNMSMNIGPADQEYDLRFIDSMILHHQGAINMAQDALNKSQRSEIKTLAQDIIVAQETEIEKMKNWRISWYPKAGKMLIMWHADKNHSMIMTEEHKKNMMMSMNLGKADAEFDLRFINMMIPHHEGALMMAKDAASKSQRSEIQKLSDEIIASQKQEIDQMKQWQEKWYKQ